MVLNLKAVALFLCASLMFSALLASAASASNDTLTTGSGLFGTTYLTGAQVGGNVFGTKSGSGIIECETGTYTGQFAGNTTELVELTPPHTGCKIGKGSATLTDNGCKYVLTGETLARFETSGAFGEDATVRLNCNDIGSIAVDGPLGCVLTLTDTHPAKTIVNQNLLGAKYSNEVDGFNWDVKATLTVDQITYTSNSKCAAFGFAATGTDGYLTTNVTLKAYSDAAHTKQVDLTLS